MIRFRYPPTVHDDGSIEYERIWKYPTMPEGFERDADNPWKLVPWWRECRHRQMSMKPRLCGQARVRMYCTCEGCPLKGLQLKPEDCEDCDYAEFD